MLEMPRAAFIAALEDHPEDRTDSERASKSCTYCNQKQVTTIIIMRSNHHQQHIMQHIYLQTNQHNQQSMIKRYKKDINRLCQRIEGSPHSIAGAGTFPQDWEAAWCDCDQFPGRSRLANYLSVFHKDGLLAMVDRPNHSPGYVVQARTLKVSKLDNRGRFMFLLTVILLLLLVVVMFCCRSFFAFC